VQRVVTRDCFVLDGVRTPIGRAGGALAAVRPDDLAATVLARLVDRPTARIDRSRLDLGRIDEVVLGDANGAGEDNRNVARMAALLAGYPTSVPGATVNRLCGSGMEAILQVSRAIECGDARLAVAGGVESMSRAPWVMLKPDRAYSSGHAQMWSTTIGWRMPNPRMTDEWTVPLGEGAELLAEKFAISRDDQDDFALESHRKAALAWSEGRFAAEVVDVDTADLATDECVRASSTRESLARLRPAFRPGGTVTAGNSSPINDGAAAVLLGDETMADELDVQPLARVAARATSALDPQWYGLGPVEASRLALDRAGLSWSDLDVVELNEAFAAQSLACLRHWPELDRELVNPNGGAIALGHPLGCSGARIVVTLAHELQRRRGRWGLAAMCIGVGQGIAVVLERT
jgi:acetyl-CoA acetyltransferase family protein